MLANFHPPNRPGSDQRFNANLVVHLSEARIVPCPRPSGHARLTRPGRQERGSPGYNGSSATGGCGPFQVILASLARATGARQR